MAQYLFQWGRSHPAASVVWAGVGGINFLLPRILLFSLHHFYFLSGFPTYTSCLANQHLFKTWLTDYRQFSRTTVQSRAQIQGTVPPTGYCIVPDQLTQSRRSTQTCSLTNLIYIVPHWVSLPRWFWIGSSWQLKLTVTVIYRQEHFVTSHWVQKHPGTEPPSWLNTQYLIFQHSLLSAPLCSRSLV